MNSAVIVAAGRSRRMGGTVDKAFLSLGSRPVVVHSLLAFEQCPDVDEIVLVVRKEQIPAAEAAVRMFGCRKVRRVVPGGATRLASVRAGLAALDPDSALVAVHDGARPGVTAELVSDCMRSAKRTGTGVAAAKVTDTLKAVGRGGLIERTVDREPLWAAQTPQAFRTDLLRRALDAADDRDPTITDESAAVERLGESVRIVANAHPNPKITYPEDVAVVARLLGIV